MEIAFDKFEGGLDRRYNRPVGGANILWVLKNAYITTGKKIKKRPCFVKVATLEAGTKGLRAAGGVLNTFYGQGTVTHANTLFKPNKVAHPTLAIDVAKAHFAELFNGFLYTSVEYTNGDVKHHYLDGTSPTHIADVNCPNTKQVVKLSQKIYAKKGGDVAFCATALPRNWTLALDSGTISSATNAAGSDVVTALGNFNNDLAIFFADGIQVWHVDPDPRLNSLKSASNSAGTVFAKAGQTLAQDFIFLAKAGFRSLSVAILTSNLQENDVGSAIDKLRSEILDTDDPTVIYFPALGQLLCFNGAKVYAYSFSRSNKLSAWSTFEFPFSIDDVAVLNSELYARSGNIVYRFDKTVFNDDGVFPLVEVEMYYQDGKSPGIEKMFIGFDAVVTGTPKVAFRYDPRDETLITPFIPISSDTRPADLYPMELCATSVAPVWNHQANEDFQLDQMLIYYEKLGAV
jgi:hypothetical protein